ncbi:MAG: choice-of-anchor D domain-containing protein [Bacteroidaceae bacterium]|nr:choice-of-anchor D domain-containing protein [Bacteroidaceae bacterium]
MISILAVLLLCFGMGARAGNIVTIGTASGAPGDEVTVSVSLANTDAVSSLQLSINMNEELSFVDGSAVLSSRSADHTVTAGVKDGALNIMVYSMSLAAISGNEGEVVSFRLKLGNQPTTVALTASKLILTDTDGNTVSGSTQNGSVSIRCAKAQYSTTTVDFGSVPIRSTYTRNVTVTNVGNEPLEVTGLQFSKYPTDFSSTTSFPFTVNAGSSASINITYAPQERGTINETVKVVCNSISKLNNISLKAQPFAVNELHVQPTSGIADEVVTVSMTMNNMDAISGFQFEFTLPAALTYIENSFLLSDRKQGHSVVQTLKDGVLRIIGYSSSDTPFTGNDGELATMQFRLSGRNSVTLKASKAILTATINNQTQNVCSADYGATITIRSPRLNANSTLNMGSTPVTQDAASNFVVRNYGNAPLTINRVTFNKENLYIRQELPLTIAANGNVTLNVVNPGIEEGDFSALMQIYSNDPEQRLWNVDISGNRFAPNYLSFTAPDIYTDEDLAVNVSMSNYDAINGLQFDVEYPSTYYEPTDELVTTARSAGLSVSQRSISANTVRYFFYSLSDAEISAGDGNVLTFKLHAKGDTPAGSYILRITNIKLGTADMVNKYAGTNITSSFNVNSYLIGDVNRDGFVDSGDVMAIYSSMAGNSDPEILSRSDVNSDGQVDSGDIMAIYSIMAGN